MRIGTSPSLSVSLGLLASAGIAGWLMFSLRPASTNARPAMLYTQPGQVLTEQLRLALHRLSLEPHALAAAGVTDAEDIGAAVTAVENGLVENLNSLSAADTAVDPDGTDTYVLKNLSWFDAAGRVINVDGGQLTKTFYDRLGRTTHQFILASINDSAYSDADDVSGDIVLQEMQTTYDKDTGLVLMTAMIERHHDDLSSGTLGALDTNADADALLYTAANIEGRIQITSNWYDSLDRLQDTVSYGTNGGANFDRDGLSVPARSDTELRTTYVYNADGTTLSITDPRGIVTRFGYDDAGRQTLVINNYVDGTPSGVTGADDVHTRYAFTDGMKTKMHVDLDGDAVEDTGDQVTTWVYGVTKGTNPGDSKIGAGHHLLKVIYPEQTSMQAEADRRVSYAYNAQGQAIWTKDQTGTIIENNYDVGSRQTHRRVTTIDGSLDNAVLRISTTYDNLGRRQLVTQYNNATVGSGSVVDEVKFTYDGWGNLTAFADLYMAEGLKIDEYTSLRNRLVSERHRLIEQRTVANHHETLADQGRFAHNDEAACDAQAASSRGETSLDLVFPLKWS